MHRGITLGLASLLGVMAASSASVRAACPVTTLESQFTNSTAVFVGRAMAERVVAASRNPGGRVTETTFEVEDRWKGASDPIVRVQTCGWTVGDKTLLCSEGVRFVVGERYLVFAAGQPLQTSACQPTERVDRAERTVRWLSGQPRR